MVSYYVHDTILLYVASLLRRRANGKRVGFPPDITTYFNLQRILLTAFCGYGWSSQFTLLYKESEEFYLGRLAVLMLHLLSPVLYLGMSISIFLLVQYLPLPTFMRFIVPYIMQIGFFNLTMAVLMLIPIPPLSMGCALFSLHTQRKHAATRYQLDFYGNAILAIIVAAQILLKQQILPIGMVQVTLFEWFLEVGLLKFH
jgi:hypothetical protein